VTDEIKIDSELALAEFIRDIRKQWLDSKYLIVNVRKGTQRTLTQNRALHLWLGMLADELNAQGLDMRKVLKQGVEIPWTTESAKEYLWRPIQEALLNKESTVDADRTEYTKVLDVLVRHLADKLNVVAPDWPRKKDAA
jgi:hypothetical protein